MIDSRILLAAVLALLCVPALADHTPEPAAVTVAGDLQEELGCSGDWQPDCAETGLVYDEDDDVWQGVFSVPAGLWQYKAPLNLNWNENYGQNAQPGGDNIPLDLAAATDVKFYYSHGTHWITDNENSVIATAAGSFQDEIGCPGDWQPWCLRSWLQDPDGDGLYSFTTRQLAAGDYEVKVAHDEDWAENYGAGGVQNGPNIPFSVADSCAPTVFTYDPVTHLLDITEGSDVAEQPMAVAIAGSLQEELGCPGDWQPDCAATQLTYDAEDGVWQGTFLVPAGDWEYKAPLNGTWDENYGLNATRDGANIPLSLDEPTEVKFYYEHGTHWVTDSVGSIIATAPGSFQDEIGCAADWQPSCLRSWLQDPDGDGIYSFSTRDIPPGSYEVKVAIDESWDENYGDGGAPGGANIAFSVAEACSEVTFFYDPVSHILTIGSGDDGPKGDLSKARAHWLAEDLVAWDASAAPGAAEVRLFWAMDGDLALTPDGLVGGESIPLTFDAAGLPQAERDDRPHLSAFGAYRLDVADLGLVPEILRARLAVAALDAEGNVLDATSVQIPGVLDDLYTYDGALGITWQGSKPTLRLWAPTARNVRLHVFEAVHPWTKRRLSLPFPSTVGDELEVVDMAFDAATGVWSVRGDQSWRNQYYLYEVEVYAPTTQQVETNLVSDPYSVSLAANSSHSQLVDLDHWLLRPLGWRHASKPPLAAPEDTVLYELHVRDFSWNDASVPEALRGTFGAFALGWSHGRRHLDALADAGLTHVHLLPSFDVATIEEQRADQEQVDFVTLRSLPRDSDEQQELVAAIDDQDGYNWGYDPWHYTVPEGSYSADPDGALRVLEFRSMVQALNRAGLRVVMDVVYNHTNAAGQNAKSVLDRIVPGYYHRLSLDGFVEQSSCCPNTATEHAMMEKLMVDSVVTWARDYKVDGFRFDLMGHHMLRNMIAVREALDALTPTRDGVDGEAIVLYGEGWNFGEVADNARGVNATQANVAGTGIGSFNDRVRDAVRGGGPFSGLQEQGFATGLYLDPNDVPQGSSGDQLANLLLKQDQIRVSLAGNLSSYELVNRFGDLVAGSEVAYGGGLGAGYTSDPQEVINYVAAHDNETFFDGVQLKLPTTASADVRARSQRMGLSLVTLGQGIPFIHAGQDMLRSKSADRDSFNSGDWFNRLDFTYQENGWPSGLPVASKNQEAWPVIQPLLADPSLDVGPAQIQATAEHFRELLRIRKSSPLFRLRTADEVQQALRYLNVGPGQIPGVIVASIDDVSDFDPHRERIVVVWNGRPDEVSFSDGSLVGMGLRLHPVLQGSADPIVRGASYDAASGTLTVPARTTAVFELPQ